VNSERIEPNSILLPDYESVSYGTHGPRAIFLVFHNWQLLIVVEKEFSVGWSAQLKAQF
jgi:hypothetical protein